MSLEKVSFTKTVKEYFNAWKNGKANFDLAIQRKDNIWNLKQKSYFVHSLLYNYPVPPFFSVEIDGKINNFIDGKQRQTSVFSYINNEYALADTTPDVDNFEIAGLKFENLDKELQDKLLNRSLTTYVMKDITDEEIEELFIRLNSGSEMKTFEKIRAIATGKVMNFVNEIATHNFFTKVVNITDSSRKRYGDQEVIMQTISLLVNGFDSGFSGKELEQFASKLKVEGIPENIQEVIKNTCDYLDQAIPVKEKNLKKVHVPMIFNLAVKAQTNEIEPSKFGGFVQEFFAHMPDEYFLATQSGSAKKENVKTRIDELNKYYDENIQSAPEFKMPEPVVRGTGKRGRPSTKNQTITVNPPGEPSPMAASGSLS